MRFTEEQLIKISDYINDTIEDVAGLYSEVKYSPQNYLQFKQVFSNRTATTEDVIEALKWKWGHANKNNYPAAQRRRMLIIAESWMNYRGLNSDFTPEQTFNWFYSRETPYISAAFIAHLVHHASGLPIIDQHNYRAMSFILTGIDENHKSKGAPSNWADVVQLQYFMQAVLPRIEATDMGRLDRYLMMLGRQVKHGKAPAFVELA